MIDVYWPFWLGGLAIFGVALLITLTFGKFLSVTRGYVSACSIFSKGEYFNRPEMGGAFGYRTLFAAGIIFGGLLAGLDTSDWSWSKYTSSFSFALGSFDHLFGDSLLVKAVVLLTGGFLWGYGSRMAGGCTSGNSIAGISKGSPAALVATLCFMIGGIFLTYIINAILGGL